ncbi:MOSC domain-containing protein [Amaricoccus tamworthensis]|uniref:MOSC domain-containing protein n=1 Tax=Amaricoccus tamworthensis TaxID=57002 RepID=UPI003C797B6A
MEARVTHIWRHPIKGVGAEALLSSEFVAGNTMPYDRVWAVAHEASKAPAGSSDWVHCNNFIRGAKSPGLMAVKAKMTGPEGLIELSHPDAGSITVNPGDIGDATRMVAWVTPLCDPNRALPSHVVRAGTRGMTDSKIRSVSILNNASLAALSKVAGRDLAQERFRGNIWLDGLEPWQEFDLLDKKLRIGGATFVVRERITRCTATGVDPETGEPDTDTLRLLQENWGHRDFGVYAEVVGDGIASVNDVAVLA